MAWHDGYQLEELVLGELLARKAQTNKGDIFARFRDADLTYDGLNELVQRAARGLLEAGVGTGAHVGVMLPNSPEFLIAVFALARIGAVSVLINTSYKGALLAHALKTADVSSLIIDEPWIPRLEEVTGELEQLRHVLVRTENAGVPQTANIESGSFRALLDRRPELPAPDVRFDDLQAIIFTSGTSGPSKGVMVPHAHALTCACDWLRYLDYRSDESIYCPLPLFHAGGLWDGVFSALLADSEIAIVERFSVSRFWDDVRRFDSNVALGIFSMLPILLNQPPRSDDKAHPLRAFYLGQSILDKPFHERFGVRSVETYASTEVGVATGSPYGQWRAGSCGRPNTRTYEVAVVDEHDRETPAHVMGELVVRPHQPFVMTTGYHHFPRATVRALRNLWFHTGDGCYRDTDGYYFFVDRLTDTIRRRGENISSFEVERSVNSHPAIEESAAVGVPSEVGEDEVKVWIRPRQGVTIDPEEIIAHCEDQLPDFMVPRFVEVVDYFPKTPLGKIKKNELRKVDRQGAEDAGS